MQEGDEIIEVRLTLAYFYYFIISNGPYYGQAETLDASSPLFIRKLLFSVSRFVENKTLDGLNNCTIVCRPFCKKKLGKSTCFLFPVVSLWQ